MTGSGIKFMAFYTVTQQKECFESHIYFGNVIACCYKLSIIKMVLITLFALLYQWKEISS